MKQVFTLVLLLVGIACNAQIKRNDYSTMTLTTGSYLVKDTLIIVPNEKIKFIKIGERVYKINAPTLTEVIKEEIEDPREWPFNIVPTDSNMPGKKTPTKQ